MARKHKEQSTQDVLQALYPDLKTSDDYEAEQAAAAKDDPGKEMQTLREQIAKLEGRLSASGAPTPVRQQSARQAPQRPDYNTLVAAAPDPVADPSGYAKYLTDLSQLQINYEKQAFDFERGQAAEAQNRVAGLWNSFSAKHTDYAKSEERVEIAASRVIAKAKAAGVDVEQYMYGQQDKFFSDVVAESDRLFGKIKAEGDDSNDDDNTDDDVDDDRSQVPAGGASAGRNGPSKTAVRPQQYGALGAMLNDWQTKTGFYR